LPIGILKSKWGYENRKDVGRAYSWYDWAWRYPLSYGSVHLYITTTRRALGFTQTPGQRVLRRLRAGMRAAAAAGFSYRLRIIS